MTDFYYSSLTNKDSLEMISSMWTHHYNCLLSQPWNEEWENKTFYDLILSEKVFDL